MLLVEPLDIEHPSHELEPVDEPVDVVRVVVERHARAAARMHAQIQKERL